MRIACMVASLLVAFTAQAQVYKWVDEKGQTHYEERPPEGKDATKMDVPAPAKEAPRPADSRDLKQQEQEFRRRQLQRQQNDAAEDRKRLQREAACTEARRRLEYESQRGRFYSTDEKGEKRFRTDEEQAAVVEATRKRVEDLCR